MQAGWEEQVMWSSCMTPFRLPAMTLCTVCSMHGTWSSLPWCLPSPWQHLSSYPLVSSVTTQEVNALSNDLWMGGYRYYSNYLLALFSGLFSSYMEGTFCKLVCAKKRNGPHDANWGFLAYNNTCHVLSTLCLIPPTSPYPTLSFSTKQQSGLCQLRAHKNRQLE